MKLLTVIEPVTNESPVIQSAFSNGTFRYEFPNIYYFENLSEAKQIIENWRLDYNQNRSQERLKGLTPSEYGNKILQENLI